MSSLLTRSKPLLSSLKTTTTAATNLRYISTHTFLSQEPQLASETLAPPPPPPQETQFPPPPPIYESPLRNQPPSLIPLNLYNLQYQQQQQNPGLVQSVSPGLDLGGIQDVFAGWITVQRWGDVKQMFEMWVRGMDRNGKRNRPDVGLYNQYLRANLMLGASPVQMLDLVERMEEGFGIRPNTASYNLVLKAMHLGNERDAAQGVLERMIEVGKEFKDTLPDGESYNLVIEMLLGLESESGHIDTVERYIDMTLRSGYTLSMRIISETVQFCAKNGRLDSLTSIIEKCKKSEQNKAICPPWNTCNDIADLAIQSDNADLGFYALEFMAKWIARGEIARPPVMLSVDEGLIVLALGTAARSYSSRLLDGAWAVLKRSLRKMRSPSPASYIAKINAHASLGSLDKAFSTLHEFETNYRDSTNETEDLFSPFTTLHPMVVACSKKGFETLDAVYYQLERLSKGDPPYTSIAALNCVILGCANIWDVDRAYQTFSAIQSSFGLTPDVHSYNAFICAFGKLQKRDETVKAFQHLISLGLKPNAKSYSLLVDVHLVKRDPRAAISVIDEMIAAGFEPTKEMLKKVRRRCIREMDYECDDKVEDIARVYKIRMGAESRRNMLFDLQYGTTEYA